MKKGNLVLIASMIFLCSSFMVNAQAKRVKTKSPAAKKSALCKSNEFSFPCPKEYKVVLNGSETTGIFLASNLEFGYSVFVIAPKGSFDKENLMTEATKTLLKALYPKESMDYRWKDVGFVNNDSLSSKFEVSQKSLLGFNGNQSVTFVYRHISFKNKNLIVGTVVDGYDKGKAAEEDFDEERVTSSGGCDDALGIIRFFTGEKSSENLNPCEKFKIGIGS
jgi:hypothetical protein